MTLNTGNAWIELLGERLKEPLPGRKVQYLMAPSSRLSRSFSFPEDSSLQLSSVMIMLFERDGRWKFPLILRPEYDGVHSGQMALPGVRSEKDDKDRIITALRETQEETGVDSARIKVIGTLTGLEVIASRNLVLPVVGYYNGIPDFQPDPGEVASIYIVDMEDLLKDMKPGLTRIKVNERYSIEAPYYDVEGRIVWGATAMILSEFLYIAREISTINNNP